MEYFEEAIKMTKKEVIVPADDLVCLGKDKLQELIRCKDCKYVGRDATCFRVCDRKGMGLKPYHVHDDDYCSYGERKTE